MTDEPPFRVVRSNSDDETLARCTNLPIAQAGYQAAAKMYPEDLIELRQGAPGDRGRRLRFAARRGALTPYGRPG
jgi:hypothetical protein